MPGVAARLRALARPVREDAVEHVERLAHLLRVRVRAEVRDAGPVPLAREHHPRVLVLDGDRDVRERLVVAEPHVERRPVPLDEVLLEVERLDLAAGDDHLDVGDPLRQLPDLRAAVAASSGSTSARATAATSPSRRRGSRPRRRGRGRRPASRASVLSCSSTRSVTAMATVAERMTGTMGRLVAALGAALVLAPAAHAGGPAMLVGATEDAVRSPTLVGGEGEDGPARARRLRRRADHRRRGRPARPPSRRPTRRSSRNVAAGGAGSTASRC